MWISDLECSPLVRDSKHDADASSLRPHSNRQEMSLVGGLGGPELCLYGIGELASATSENISWSDQFVCLGEKFLWKRWFPRGPLCLQLFLAWRQPALGNISGLENISGFAFSLSPSPLRAGFSGSNILFCNLFSWLVTFDGQTIFSSASPDGINEGKSDSSRFADWDLWEIFPVRASL